MTTTSKFWTKRLGESKSKILSNQKTGAEMTLYEEKDTKVATHYDKVTGVQTFNIKEGNTHRAVGFEGFERHFDDCVPNLSESLALTFKDMAKPAPTRVGRLEVRKTTDTSQTGKQGDTSKCF